MGLFFFFFSFSPPSFYVRRGGWTDGRMELWTGGDMYEHHFYFIYTCRFFEKTFYIHGKQGSTFYIP